MPVAAYLKKTKWDMTGNINKLLSLLAKRYLSLMQPVFSHFYVIGHEAAEFGRITQNNGHYAAQGHSRSPILVSIESPYGTSISHRFQVIADYWSFSTGGISLQHIR